MRLLCRGLLTRDPRRRWTGDEVERWLAGQSPAVAEPDPPRVAALTTGGTRGALAFGGHGYTDRGAARASARGGLGVRRPLLLRHHVHAGRAERGLAGAARVAERLRRGLRGPHPADRPVADGRPPAQRQAAAPAALARPHPGAALSRAPPAPRGPARPRRGDRRPAPSRPRDGGTRRTRDVGVPPASGVRRVRRRGRTPARSTTAGMGSPPPGAASRAGCGRSCRVRRAGSPTRARRGLDDPPVVLATLLALAARPAETEERAAIGRRAGPRRRTRAGALVRLAVRPGRRRSAAPASPSYAPRPTPYWRSRARPATGRRPNAAPPRACATGRSASAGASPDARPR